MILRAITPQWAVPLLAPCRYKGARGGRGSGKSWFFAQEIVVRCAAYPDTSVVCIREVQKSIKLSSKRLIENTITKLGVSHLFDVLATEIRCKHGKGIIVFQGMQDHTSDSIKSLEDFQIAWIEEAQSISERSLRLLRPTMRSGSELWFSWNPELDDDPVELLFADADNDDGMVVVDVNYPDNPFFPQELRDEMERDRRLLSPQMFDHTWHGKHITGDMGEVFRWSWFKQHNVIPPQASRIVHSWDTAYKTDQHNDPSALTVWRIHDAAGKAYLEHVEVERMDYPTLRARVLAMAVKYPPSAILIEDKASGQSLLQELKAVTSLPFIAINPTEDKVTRAVSCCGTIEAGNVSLPVAAPWLADYRKELIKFNHNKDLIKNQKKDQVDSTSQFINWWQGAGRRDMQFEQLLQSKYGQYGRR